MIAAPALVRRNPAGEVIARGLVPVPIPALPAWCRAIRGEGR